MRCSAGSPPGHSARKRSKSRWRQITPLDSSIEPPARSPFSRSSTRGAAAPRPARRRRGRPCRRRPRSGRASRSRSSENSGLCSTYSSWMPSGPHTKNANVFAASRTSAISMPAVARLVELLLAGVHQQRDVVQQRALGLGGRSGARARTCLSPTASRSSAVRAQAERRQASRARAPGRGRAAPRGRCRTRRRCRSPRPDPRPRPSGASKVATPSACVRPRSPLGSARARGSRSDTRSTTRSSGAGLARALGREQRQLAAPRIRPHEREGVRAIDYVHPGVLAQEVRQRVAVGDPQGDVVEGGWLPSARCL